MLRWTPSRKCVAIALLCNVVYGTPVGLITSLTGGRLVRSGTTTRLHAKAGDLLFSGDRLISEKGEAVDFVFCPSLQAYSIDEASIEIGASRVRTLSGRLSQGAAVR